MQYLGGKSGIKIELHAFFNKIIQENQDFVDLFCGACNIVEGVQTSGIGRRHANDSNQYLIDLYRYVLSGGELPDSITEQEYKNLNVDRKSGTGLDWLIGFAGFGCSFAGKFFGGYARGKTGNYALAAKKTLEKQSHLLKNVFFSCKDYRNFIVPNGAIVYCDIPYRHKIKYNGTRFNHVEFLEWVEKNKKMAHIYISEYAENVPDGYRVVWIKESSQSIRGRGGICRKTQEVLITPVL